MAKNKKKDFKAKAKPVVKKPKVGAAKKTALSKDQKTKGPQKPLGKTNVSRGVAKKSPLKKMVEKVVKKVLPLEKPLDKSTASKNKHHKDHKEKVKKVTPLVPIKHVAVKPKPEETKAFQKAPKGGPKKDNKKNVSEEEKFVDDDDDFFEASEEEFKEVEEVFIEEDEAEEADEEEAVEVLAVEVATVEVDRDDVILTDAEGRKYCRAQDCDQIGVVEGYCRYHYLLFWKKIQVRKKILADGKLERYVEELTSRYPDKFLEMIRKDLRSEKDFLGAIQELEIDESGIDNEFEEETQSFIEEVRGMGSETGASEEEEY